MKTLSLIFLAAPLMAQTPLWKEISRLEAFLQRGINSLGGEALVFPSDPVRGYHLPGQGVVVVVPLRYRLNTTSALESEFPRKDKEQKEALVELAGPDPGQLSRKVRQWQQTLNKREAIKEAGFALVLRHLEKLMPELAAGLPSLAAGEGLTVIVEEHEPAHIYASFEPSRENTRKVSLLSLDAQALGELRSSKGQGKALFTVHATRLAAGALSAETRADSPRQDGVAH
jgi:hypothetical protein